MILATDAGASRAAKELAWRHAQEAAAARASTGQPLEEATGTPTANESSSKDVEGESSDLNDPVHSKQQPAEACKTRPRARPSKLHRNRYKALAACLEGMVEQ